MSIRVLHVHTCAGEETKLLLVDGVAEWRRPGETFVGRADSCPWCGVAWRMVGGVMWESYGEGPFGVAKHLAQGIDEWEEVLQVEPFWGAVSAKRKAEMFAACAMLFAAKAAEWQAKAASEVDGVDAFKEE